MQTWSPDHAFPVLSLAPPTAPRLPRRWARTPSCHLCSRSSSPRPLSPLRPFAFPHVCLAPPLHALLPAPMLGALACLPSTSFGMQHDLMAASFVFVYMARTIPTGREQPCHSPCLLETVHFGHIKCSEATRWEQAAYKQLPLGATIDSLTTDRALPRSAWRVGHGAPAPTRTRRNSGSDLPSGDNLKTPRRVP